MSSQTLNLTPEVYAYLQKFSLREDPTLQALRKETAKLTMAGMQISPEQGQFMALLMKLMGAKNTLDIGTFTGYSALVVALSLPPDGKVVACDVSTSWTDIARQHWEQAKMSDKIDLKIAPALKTLQTLIDEGKSGTFDFAFIDADKANYQHYYEKALTLLRQGGVVAIDNVLWQGRVADEHAEENETRAIRAFNEMIAKDERITLSMLPIGDGLTLAMKN